MKLLVGLGNPGAKYESTRHNIGFAVLDYLAAAPGVGSWRTRFQSQVIETTEAGQQVLLMKPETFMNLSGRALRAALDFYKLAPTDVLVICDDIALPLGKLRVRATGSHGGQNGLRNIQEAFGTPDYARLRIGVGSPGEYQDAAEYVLSRFKPAERTVINEAIAKAAQASLIWLAEGIDVCMNRTNAEPKPDKPKKEKPPKEVKPKETEPKTAPNPTDTNHASQ